jgi:hypothetical protein
MSFNSIDTLSPFKVRTWVQDPTKWNTWVQLTHSLIWIPNVPLYIESIDFGSDSATNLLFTVAI